MRPYDPGDYTPSDVELQELEEESTLDLSYYVESLLNCPESDYDAHLNRIHDARRGDRYLRSLVKD